MEKSVVRMAWGQT